MDREAAQGPEQQRSSSSPRDPEPTSPCSTPPPCCTSGRVGTIAARSSNASVICSSPMKFLSSLLRRPHLPRFFSSGTPRPSSSSNDGWCRRSSSSPAFSQPPATPPPTRASPWPLNGALLPWILASAPKIRPLCRIPPSQFSSGRSLGSAASPARPRRGRVVLLRGTRPRPRLLAQPPAPLACPASSSSTGPSPWVSRPSSHSPVHRWPSQFRPA